MNPMKQMKERKESPQTTKSVLTATEMKVYCLGKAFGKEEDVQTTGSNKT